MKILIIGGRKKSDFLIKSLLEKKHNVTVINYDYDFCKELSRKYEAPVICGDGTKTYILEDANINDTDVVIAMTPKDADNLVICQLSKKVYGIKKAFATVSNPKNVEVFRNLGIDIAISSTYVVSDMIEQMATIDEIYDMMPIEGGKVSIMEIIVNENYTACEKLIKDVEFEDEAIIGCIVRGSTSIIPKGNTKILKNDKLIIMSPPSVQKKVVSDIVGGVNL